MAHTLNVAIAGFGKSARNFHTPLIEACEGLHLHSVLKRSGSAQLENYPGIKVYRMMDDLLAGGADVVIITTPNHLHHKMALQALTAGKHVVVEKPFTVRSEEADELIRLARKKSRLITVFQNRRWDGDFLTLQKVLQQRLTGRPVELISTFNRFRNYLREDAWKEKSQPGSGILYDLGPHLLDQALCLFGWPKALYADIRAQREGDADDYFEIDLHYPQMKVKLKAGMLVLDDTPRFVLRGDQGAFVKYGMDPQEEAMAAGKEPGSPGWGEEPPERFGTLRKWKDGRSVASAITTEPGDYLFFYNNLVQAINGDAPPAVQPDEALLVIKLIEKAMESHHKGQLVTLNHK